MITLGCNPQDPKFGFPELRDKDLYTKNVDEPHNLGDGGKVEGWQKEVEILAQEFHCAIQGFKKMETVRTALAHDYREDPGKKAYALKKADMYQEIGKDAQEKFAKVGGTWSRAGVGLAQHIKSEHPDQKIDWDASIAKEN
ncbi:hypothetical protein DFH08DRAFT_817163 [Mycena albidolilacea]|uniref:Uncharacterized protein n=1 Tax=Mycena albidolilacea TaxID=1033008 RepID=A0AAD7EIU5_9AGAR|nr:hypothetical protein DFH08DRAFT_817163 [Mycena albidolilacea]